MSDTLEVNGVSYQKVKTPEMDFEGVEVRLTSAQGEWTVYLDMDAANDLTDRLITTLAKYDNDE